MFHTGTQMTTTRRPARIASPIDATSSARKYVHTTLSACRSEVAVRALVIETPPIAYASA
jgi:hypothetical protein